MIYKNKKMEKQKICIVGGGLTGLITAITLSKLNLKIDLITGNINQYTKSNRTIAISQNNYDFLKKLKILNLKNIIMELLQFNYREVVLDVLAQ